jgi:hypothetical protein
MEYRTDLAKCTFPNGTVEIKVEEVDLTVEIYWFREAAPHLAFRG